MSDPATILVLKPSSLGDIVHTLPTVALLRKKWPEARIVWMVNPEWAPLLEDNPLRLEPWIFRRKEFGSAAGLLRCREWIRARTFGNPDLALDFQGLLRSAVIGKFVKPKLFLGLSDAREGAGFLYHRRAKVGVEHAVERYLKLAKIAGANPGAIEWPLPAGRPVPDMELPEQFVLLHPFSRGKGKSLEPHAVERLCDLLSPLPIILVGRTEETIPPRPHVINLLNQTTLVELIWLLRKASYVVSVDSGPMHLAAATTKCLLSIHTWSDPRLVGPYLPEAWIWKGETLQRMGDYAAVEASAPPGNADLAKIADHVRSRIGS